MGSHSLKKLIDFSSRPLLRLALAALVAAITLWLLAAPVEASGGGITVLESRHQVNFPDDVRFTLTVEGENEIVEVRLLFRALGQANWSHADAGFDPGAHVSVTFVLDLGGFNYLPPGAELEYYYVIRDAQSNVHKTTPTVIEYTDDRFQWERTRIGPLLLSHRDISESRVETVTQEVEEALQHISSLLGVDSLAPIKGVIYNSRDEAQGALPFQSETISEAQVFGGFSFPSSGVFVGIGFQTRVIVHESAHLLFHQALGPDALPLPAWLDEGFASYVEPDTTQYSGRSLSSRGLPLPSMTRVSGTPRDITLFYQKSGSVLAYLIEEYGVEPFQQFVAELGRGRTTEEAMFKTYGFRVEGLEARWAADANRPAAPAPGSPAANSPWVNFSGLVIGALAVTVLLATLLRQVIKRFRPAVGLEEGLQPWEDPDLLDPYDDDFPR